MQIEDCRIVRRVAEWNSQGIRSRGRPVNTRKDGFRGRMQIRNLKDQEYFYPELWRGKIVYLG
jgi:hypothetical protein